MKVRHSSLTSCPKIGEYYIPIDIELQELAVKDIEDKDDYIKNQASEIHNFLSMSKDMINQRDDIIEEIMCDRIATLITLNVSLKMFPNSSISIIEGII